MILTFRITVSPYVNIPCEKFASAAVLQGVDFSDLALKCL